MFGALRRRLMLLAFGGGGAYTYYNSRTIKHKEIEDRDFEEKDLVYFERQGSYMSIDSNTYERLGKDILSIKSAKRPSTENIDILAIFYDDVLAD